MSVNKFEIKTFHSFKFPIINFKKKVYDADNNILPINPKGDDITTRAESVNSIDIHKLSIDDGEEFLRDLSEDIRLELIPSWINHESFTKEIKEMLFPDEDPYKSLHLNVRIICPALKYVIDSKNVSLEVIDKNDPISFPDILLKDIEGKVVVESELLRTKSANPSRLPRAYSSLTILARNHDISFYVDEIEDIGSNALEIIPGFTDGKLFIIKNTSPFGIDVPKLVYNKDLKGYFSNGDDYQTIQTILLLIGAPYIDALLKWICFGAPDLTNNDHYTVVRFLSEIIEIEDEIFRQIIELTPEDEERLRFYLSNSNSLFEKIQQLDKGWNSYILKFLKNE